MRPYGPLRGRDHELSTALAVIRRTRTHGASGVVLISGNAGVGKTALLSEICRQAAHMNIRLARSKCDEIEQASPGAPIVGLLRTGRDPLLAAPEFQEINALTAEPLLLVDCIASQLARLADGQRLLLAVDDVQWADRVSRYALRALISRLVGIPVVWVLASRSDEVGLAVSAADSVEVQHIRLGPLADSAIADIARDRWLERVAPAARLRCVLQLVWAMPSRLRELIGGPSVPAPAGVHGWRRGMRVTRRRRVFSYRRESTGARWLRLSVYHPRATNRPDQVSNNN